MNEFDNISDEQLACFIEDNLCEVECDCILDAVACDSDMDVLSIAYHASKLVDNEIVDTPKKIVDLPRWNNNLAGIILPASMSAMSHQLRESAFLGDDSMTLEGCCDCTEDPEDLGICACRAEYDDLTPFDEFENNDGPKE